MFKKSLIVIGGVVIALWLLIASRPSEFRVTRTATINASSERVFAQINDFHNWKNWSPWVKLDPNAKNVLEGPAAGVGATFKWVGNEKVGEGIQTITESRANEFIKIKLEFLKPFKATNTTEFTFTPQGEQTLMSWSMSGENSFAGKAMSLIFNCDKMVGDQFEKGLANLNAYISKE